MSQNLVSFSCVLERKQKSNRKYTQYWFDTEDRVGVSRIIVFGGKSSSRRQIKFHLRAHVRVTQESKDFLRKVAVGLICLGVLPRTEVLNRPRNYNFADELNLSPISSSCDVVRMSLLGARAENPNELDLCTEHFVFSDTLETISENDVAYSFVLFEMNHTGVVKRVSHPMGKFKLLLWHSTAERLHTRHRLSELDRGAFTYERFLALKNEDAEKQPEQQQQGDDNPQTQQQPPQETHGGQGGGQMPAEVQRASPAQVNYQQQSANLLDPPFFEMSPSHHDGDDATWSP